MDKSIELIHIIIVDDWKGPSMRNHFLIASNDFFNNGGLSVSQITVVDKGRYTEKTRLAVREAYKRGEIPVILMDQNFNFKESHKNRWINGTSVLREATRPLTEEEIEELVKERTEELQEEGIVDDQIEKKYKGFCRKRRNNISFFWRYNSTGRGMGEGIRNTTSMACSTP